MRLRSVIGVASLPGGGKSELIRRLVQRFPGSTVLSCSDFDSLGGWSIGQLQDWLVSGADFNAVTFNGLHAAIEHARANSTGQFVFLENLMGRANKELAAYIDILIVLNTPADVALARKLGDMAGDVMRQPPDEPSFADWLHTYLSHYQTTTFAAYAALQERVPARADIIIDGRRTLDAIEKLAVAAIEERISQSVSLHRGTTRPPLVLSEFGRSVLDYIESAGNPFGLERSFKVSDARISEDRFIATMHRDFFGEDHKLGISSFARTFGMPEPILERFLSGMQDVEIVHVGFEGPDTVKIYFELNDRARYGSRQVFQGRELLYLAAKWRPNQAGEPAVSRYFRPLGDPSRSTLKRRLHDYFTTDADRMPSLKLAGSLLELTVSKCSDDAITFSEVADEETPRRSFDLNVYAADLPVSKIEPHLRDMLAQYGIEEPRVDELLGRISTMALGHLSGGFDRHGNGFSTVYYGFEPRVGTEPA